MFSGKTTYSFDKQSQMYENCLMAGNKYNI